METKVFHSEMDASINVWVNGFEARFVQRTPDYFIIYLSTMKGCNQHCRMCHLTATGQTDATLAEIHDLVEQFGAVIAKAKEVHDFEKIVRKAKVMHINYMARGEPILNRHLLGNWYSIHRNYEAKFTELTGCYIPQKPIISTIFPEEVGSGREDVVFKYLENLSRERYPPSIYYSLYSLDSRVRKKWLPRALPYQKALMYLNYYEAITKRDNTVTNKIHFALIDGVNDRIRDLEGILTILKNPYLPALRNIPFNIVRYNPYSDKYGREASESFIEWFSEELTAEGHPTKVIPKVGFDVKASCGMFLEQKDLVK